jgi:serine/threonine protein kinase
MADITDPARQVGRYRIVREIGRGGMAAVYLARQTDLDRDVALKELSSFHAADPAFAERFVRESRVAGSMSHPNVVTVYEYLNEGGTPYIAMEYVERGSLRPFVGRTTMAQTIGVLEGALAGLAQAERREIVHRDIKPENLMVTADGEVKIADFGIAKALTDAGGPNLTMTGTTVGTPAYMAPEQATAGDVGPWTDLYSLGITAYEMTVSRVPFHDSTTPVAVLMRQVSEEIPSAISVDPRVDRRFSDWIDRLLVKDPEQRARTARDAWYELEEIAVAMLGPLWRREARLLVSGTDRAAGPLTPAPFERSTPPPQGAGGGYETYLGDSPGAAPPPPAPPSPPQPVGPPATIPGQPVPPAAPVAADPARTVAPASAAPAGAAGAPPTSAGNETFAWPSQGGGRNRLVIVAAIVVIAAIAAGVFLVTRSGGSSKSGSPPATKKSGGKPQTKPAALPTIVADPTRFQAGPLQSIAGLGNQAWALDHRKPRKVVQLGAGLTGASIPAGKGAVSLASGENALWVTAKLPGGNGEVRKFVPGSTAPAGAPIPYPGNPAAPRVVVSNGTIWQPTNHGVVKLSETGGSPVQVKGLDFQPDSLELEGGFVWATDGKAKLARIDTTSAQPEATVVPLAGAGWITGDTKSVYVVSASGVVKVDPKNPATQTPVAGISAAPTRIGLAGDILWTISYADPAGGSRVATLTGYDVDHPGKATTPFTFKAPATGGYVTKLVDIDNTFWLVTLGGPNGETSGLEPYTIKG